MTYLNGFILATGPGDSVADELDETNAAFGYLNAPNDVIYGELEASDDYDYYETYLTADGVYDIALNGEDSGSGTLYDPVVVVYDADGNSVASNDDGGDGHDSLIAGFTPDSDGNYYILARSFGASYSGTYELVISGEGGEDTTDGGDDSPDGGDDGDDYADDQYDGTAPIGSVAVNGSANGDLEEGGDRDTFAIDLTEGYTYSFDLLGTASGGDNLGDPYLRLYDQYGDQVAYNDDGGSGLDSLIEDFVADYSGTYYLQAGAFGDYGSGSYTLEAHSTETTVATDDYADDLDDDTAPLGSVAVGGSATGEIEESYDVDKFAVELEAGTTYNFSMLGTASGGGTLYDTYLYLYDSDGNQIDYNDDGGEGLESLIEDFTAGETGTYYLGAAAFGSGTGSYTVEVEATGETGGPIYTGDHFLPYAGYIPEDLVDMIMGDSGLSISNAQLIGSEDAASFYFGGIDGIDIDDGILLTSGDNTPPLENTSSSYGQNNGEPGDAALTQVAQDAFPGAGTTNDATILSFDVTIPENSDANSLAFDLVYASDEYPEFSDTSFVDVAAVHVDGVNYAYFNNDISQPLSVIDDNLSAGNFIDNSDGGIGIEYDGVSGRVSVVVSGLDAGTHHVEIGVADTGDYIYDSGLFVSNVRGIQRSFTGDLGDEADDEEGPVGGLFLVINGTKDDDVLDELGEGLDEIYEADEGNDVINPGGGDDIINADDGDDLINSGEGDNDIFGGLGFDTVSYNMSIFDVGLTANDSDANILTVEHSGGSDSLMGIEYLQFTDYLIATDDIFGYEPLDEDNGEPKDDIDVDPLPDGIGEGDGDDDSGGGTVTDFDDLGEGADVVNVQRGIVGMGEGNDVYVLAGPLLDDDAEITISDGQGDNFVQMIDGLTIVESAVASNTARLTLDNGAEITILDAGGFTYVLGGSPTSGTFGDQVDFEGFVTDVLGYDELPTTTSFSSTDEVII